jgi:hypothetical protein
MFFGCKKLTNAPLLPALRLKDMCYNEMFSCCHGLVYINVRTLDMLGIQYSAGWVEGIKTKGILTLNKNIDWKPKKNRACVPSSWKVVKE